jgi:hypothetical protein
MDFGSSAGPLVYVQGFDSDFKEALKCRAGTVWASGRSWTYTLVAFSRAPCDQRRCTFSCNHTLIND